MTTGAREKSRLSELNSCLQSALRDKFHSSGNHDGTESQIPSPRPSHPRPIGSAGGNAPHACMLLFWLKLCIYAWRIHDDVLPEAAPEAKKTLIVSP